jgi:hypothetical protein
MSTPVPKVYRGSVRPVGWSLYTDLDASTPRLLPADAVAFLTLTRWGETLTKRSDEPGLLLFVGNEATDSPATVTWTPTLDESRMFTGRVHVELEYWADGDQLPLLPPDAALDFVNGKNLDEDET